MSTGNENEAVYAARSLGDSLALQWCDSPANRPDILKEALRDAAVVAAIVVGMLEHGLTDEAADFCGHVVVKAATRRARRAA